MVPGGGGERGDEGRRADSGPKGIMSGYLLTGQRAAIRVNTGSARLKETPPMTGIQFITDAKGRRTAAVIDLRKHKALWEDIEDGLVSESRRREKGIPLERIKADLVKRGRLHG